MFASPIELTIYMACNINTYGADLKSLGNGDDGQTSNNGENIVGHVRNVTVLLFAVIWNRIRVEFELAGEIDSKSHL